MNIKEEYQKDIYNWVAKNFGESEAEDPSWSIEALAEEMQKTFLRLHEEIIRTDIADAVQGVADDNGIELTDKELDLVVDEYRYSEAYCEDDPDAILHFINEVKGE